MTVIDTSLFVDAQRGQEAARQRLDELLRSPESLAVSAMTVLEVYSAPRMSRAWARFCASIFEAVEVLELDVGAAEKARGEWVSAPSCGPAPSRRSP